MNLRTKTTLIEDSSINRTKRHGKRRPGLEATSKQPEENRYERNLRHHLRLNWRNTKYETLTNNEFEKVQEKSMTENKNLFNDIITVEEFEQKIAPSGMASGVLD